MECAFGRVEDSAHDNSRLQLGVYEGKPGFLATLVLLPDPGLLQSTHLSGTSLSASQDGGAAAFQGYVNYAGEEEEGEDEGIGKRGADA